MPHPFARQLGYDPTEPARDEQDPAFALGLPSLDIDILDGVTALFDHSLLRRVDASDGEARYEMLETIREFGLEQLETEGESRAARHAHAAVMLAFAEATSYAAGGPGRAPRSCRRSDSWHGSRATMSGRRLSWTKRFA